MYSVGMVSLCTRKKKLDMLPTSIPSPTLRVEVVSTHALSPSPASETLTTLALERPNGLFTAVERNLSIVLGSIEAGTTTPSTPLSSTVNRRSTSRPSSSIAESLLPLRENSATRFSRGIINQLRQQAT